MKERKYTLTEADAQSELRRRLGKKTIRKDIWATLKKDGHVDEYLNPEFVLDQEDIMDIMVEKYMWDDENYPATKPRRVRYQKAQEIEVPPDRRQEVKSKILAHEASNYWIVKEFREEVLGGALLNMDELHPWMKRVEEEQQKRRTFTITLPQDFWPGEWNRIPPADFASRLSSLTSEQMEQVTLMKELGPEVRYWASEDEVGKNFGAFVRAAPDSVLSRLKAVCFSLSERYEWKEPDSISFVLCGIAPNPSTATASRTCSGSLDYITIKAQAHVTKETVLGLFDKMKNIFPGREKKRDRQLSEKHLMLAEFAATFTDNETWEDRRQKWNSKCTEEKLPAGYKYATSANFPRDVRNVWKKVRGKALKEKRMRIVKREAWKGES